MSEASQLTAAVIDVGSNTVRLCMYRVEKSGGKFTKIIDAKDSVGLGAYIGPDKTMSKGGIEAGGKAIRKLARMAEVVGFKKMGIFATAAVRNCANSAEVAKEFQQKCGYPVRVLTGEEEAYLSVQGALASAPMRSGLFFDLGGGSTEVVGLQKGKVTVCDSIPIGSLTSWRRNAHCIIPGEDELEAIEQGFAELLRTSPVNPTDYKNICGIGGSTRLALKVANHLRYSSPDNRTLSLESINRIFDMNANDRFALSRLVLQIQPSRVHTFLPGCAIMRAIMEAAGIDYLEVAKTGIREGYLLKELR
ncbi:MAG: hypothetical protein Q4E12_05625 [Coriobacteriia bacterium]|nr:hypothetical protein [Coriobacteriia bacterium]